MWGPGQNKKLEQGGILERASPAQQKQKECPPAKGAPRTPKQCWTARSKAAQQVGVCEEEGVAPARFAWCARGTGDLAGRPSWAELTAAPLCLEAPLEPPAAYITPSRSVAAHPRGQQRLGEVGLVV